jgi:hypothetical protein
LEAGGPALDLTCSGLPDAIGQVAADTAGYAYFLQFFRAYVCRSVAAPEVSLDDYWAVEAGLLHELDLVFFEDCFGGWGASVNGVG